MQIIGNLGAKRNLYFKFSAPPPLCPKIVPASLRGADVYLRYKHIYHLNKWNIARNIMCFIINVINVRKKLARLIYILILFKVQQSSEYVLKLEFKPKHA